ncbi:voltage-dependent calcium channel type D subunit alpha-1-like protein [Anopheles sinensis]|uniref:Voltage-dependent calcium channel type D subunit alpha-1-like protein n=1 Tax=Anopheles sinensis TaxID=74873 RepID=A0A084W5P4_ANOSI|nr:voltage-dependent calcium channel type D subunit alpha-1-like protein [Anopheles sinensis]
MNENPPKPMATAATTGVSAAGATASPPPAPPAAASGVEDGAAADGTGANNQPKRTPRRPGKVQPERPKRVFYCLTDKNPLRVVCTKVVEWKYV